MSGLKLYFDYISPVSRAVMLLTEANKIPCEMVHIALKSGENRSNPDFTARSQFKTVPLIDDDGFVLSESTAILRYLSAKYNVPDHWYPKDLQRRAWVDEALSYFPGNIRCGCFFFTCVAPVKFNKPRDDAKCAETRAKLKAALDITESHFLKDRKFIGGDEISIADLQFFCEVTQYWMTGNDIYKGRPNMERWIEDCKKALSPSFDSVYGFVYKMQESGTFHVDIDVGP